MDEPLKYLPVILDIRHPSLFAILVGMIRLIESGRNRATGTSYGYLVLLTAASLHMHVLFLLHVNAIIPCPLLGYVVLNLAAKRRSMPCCVCLEDSGEHLACPPR